jgi:hypothetical protein
VQSDRDRGHRDAYRSDDPKAQLDDRPHLAVMHVAWCQLAVMHSEERAERQHDQHTGGRSAARLGA